MPPPHPRPLNLYIYILIQINVPPPHPPIEKNQKKCEHGPLNLYPDTVLLMVISSPCD